MLPPKQFQRSFIASQLREWRSRGKVRKFRFTDAIAYQAEDACNPSNEVHPEYTQVDPAHSHPAQAEPISTRMKDTQQRKDIRTPARHTPLAVDYGHIVRQEDMIDRLRESLPDIEHHWLAIGETDEDGFSASVAYCSPGYAALIASAPQLAEENAKLREMLARYEMVYAEYMALRPDPNSESFRLVTKIVQASRAILNQTAERL